MASDILDEIKFVAMGEEGNGEMHVNDWITDNICKYKFSSNLVFYFLTFTSGINI